MIYTKEKFKELWEANEWGSSITYDDIADCAVAWGISYNPRLGPINEIAYKVLKAAQVNDAEEYNPNPAPKKREEIGCGWCIHEAVCEQRKHRTIPTRQLARECGNFVHYQEIKSKSKEEVEDIAFRALRNSKNKTLLNNHNVDCFVAGWQAAERDFWQQLNSQKAQEFKDYLQQTIDQCKEKHDKLREELGYSGYMCSIPQSADAFFKMLDEMIRSCEYILANLENVNLYHGDYYEKLKGGEE